MGAIVDLQSTLDEFARASTPVYGEEVQELRRRLAEGVLRVAICGEAKRGKSSLINALVGREVLPAGVTPLTIRTTWIRSGSPERVEVPGSAGTTRRHELGDLPGLVARGRAQHEGTDPVQVYLRDGLPAQNLVLIDTPGIGSIFAEDSARAQESQEGMDVAVLVLTADAPLSQSERDLLRRLATRSVEAIVVLNKVDLLSGDDALEVMRFIADHVGRELGRKPVVLPCSARSGLRAKLLDDPDGWSRSGCGTLESMLVERGTGGREEMLGQSLAATAARLVRRQLDATSVEMAALQAIVAGTPQRVRRFADSIDDSRRLERQANDLWRGEVQRRLTELNEDASASIAPVARLLLDALGSWLAANVDAPPAVIERDGRAAIAAALTTEVDTWRTSRVESLGGLVASQQRLVQELLDRAADELARAAARHLGVELRAGVATLPEPEVHVSPYDVSPDVGWNTAAVVFVRRHGSGAHRRAIAFMRAECARLADKHLGRARSDIQRGLDDADREVQRRLAAAFAELRKGLQVALEAAEESLATSVPEQQAAMASVKQRRQQLAELLERFQDGEPTPCLAAAAEVGPEEGIPR